MAASPPPAVGRIFISYRREETAYPAAWLYDRLADRFGGGQVFKDVDSIELGDDFVEVITTAVGSCDVLLAVIGPRWLDATDEDGRRRLDDPDDFVRLEIEAALARNVRVIPILVDGARMPRATDLPPSLVRLVRRQALELSPNRFELDTSRLLSVLEKTLSEVRTAQAQAAGTAAPAGTAAAPSTSKPPAAPEQQQRAEPRLTSGSSPAAPTGAATARPPSGSGPPPDDQHRRRFTWAWVLAGAGALLVLVVVAIVASSDRRPSTAEGVIFRDDFSGRASGWEDVGSASMGGHYTDDAYRISVPPAARDVVNRASFPAKARPVYPSAPSNLRIEVDGRRLPESNDDTGYGIQCRVDGENYYDFTITDNDATIAKAESGIVREVLELPIDANAMNRLQATCTNVEAEGQRSVHLVFSVNDRVVAEYTDTKNPYLTGTVGLTVWTAPAERPGLVQFDNFTVTHA
jgi:TIR domain